MSIPFRVGQGYDVHALTPGRKLVLGGVEIPHHQGLLGHSDADALLHAITDAILGAAGLGDIGRIAPHVAAMCANIAADLGIAAGAVNIKGKTSERLGFAGRGEGIAAQAVALLLRKD